MIPISNHGEHPIFVGGRMIPPGETVTFEDGELPPEYRVASVDVAVEAEGDDPLLALVDLPIAKLALGLPELSDDELERLEGLEQAKEKPRAGALAEIVAERLRRAEQSAPGGLESTDEASDNADAGGVGE